MKKLKRQRSTIEKVKQNKQTSECRTPVPSKKNLLQKKQLQSHKENKSMIHEAAFIPKPVKKTCLKTKQRSKSLLNDRKIIDPQTQSSQRYALMDLLQKKGEKAETDISGYHNSIKYEKQFGDYDRVESQYLSPLPPYKGFLSSLDQNQYQISHTPKLKKLQEENQTLKANLTAIKEQTTHCNRQNKIVKEQYSKLKSKITEFELTHETQLAQWKTRQNYLTTSHKKEKQGLNNKIDRLQRQKQELIEEKEYLQVLVKRQQDQIQGLQSKNVELQMKWQHQIKEKQQIKREKEAAIHKIKELQMQLEVFDQNIKQFQKLKGVYENRLNKLQAQKQSIKKNACDLLQMVRSYKNLQQ